MSRVKDPELLRALKPLWREHGCGVCGRTVTDEVPAGMDVELAHFDRRSQLGPDDAANIIGLCGELTECKAHARFDRYTLNIKRNESGGFVWMDTSPGGHVWQPISMPPEVLAMIAAGEPGGWNIGSETPGDSATRDGAPDAALPEVTVAVDGSVVPTADPSPLLPAAPVGDLATTGSGGAHTADPVPAAAGEPHEKRYTALRGLVQRSERDRLAAAMLLWEAREQRDHERLDQSWPEYVSSAGLSKSAASKMLTAAEIFRGQWLQLAQVDQADLNLERVYLASRLVSERGLDTMEALHEAVANPSHQLVAQLKGDEPSDRCECVCPHCSKKINHIKETAA